MANSEVLRWSIIPTPVGLVALVASNRGIRSVRVGADEQQLADELFADFGHHTLIRDDDSLAETTSELRSITEGNPSKRLQTDVCGTAFQENVWSVLEQIPIGETRSYADVARAIGKPRAVRAVARACAMNPIALVVPCHRVVRSNGELSGYRWGVAVKQSLLKAERAPIAVGTA